MDFLALILCAYLVLVLVHALRFLKKKASTSPSHLPPGPPPLRVIGNLLELGDLPHNSLAKLSRTYGPIIKLQLGHVTTIVVSSPAIAREILQTHDAIFSNRTIPNSITALRQDELGLPWVPVSPLWRNLRKICNLHIFSHKKLESNQHIRHEKVQELVSYIKRRLSTGDAVDIGEVAFKTVVNLLSKTMLSEDLADPSGSARDLKDLVWRIMVEAGNPNLADYFPALKRIDPQGSRRRMTVYFMKIFELFDSLIEKRLRDRAEAIYPGLPLALRILHWILGSLINSFNWELEGGVKPEDMSMEEKFGITLQRAQPLRVIPKPV
ncbi:hypothetical protein NL676_011369 [Syzygium grande]|nr:hypothetical protein NL676_011369 [Syzygium grande]